MSHVVIWGTWVSSATAMAQSDHCQLPAFHDAFTAAFPALSKLNRGQRPGRVLRSWRGRVHDDADPVVAGQGAATTGSAAGHGGRDSRPAGGGWAAERVGRDRR